MAYYRHEFPDFDYELKIAKGFYDDSWHNDIMPHIRKDLNNGFCIVIWQDYLDEDRRESWGKSKRFCVQLIDENMENSDEGIIKDFNTDSFQFAVKVAEKFEKELAKILDEVEE